MQANPLAHMVSKENRMNIKITTDSTCDLSADLLAKYNISLVPLIVMKRAQ